MSSGANLTGAKDLVQNRHVFAVVNNSSFAFLAYRYLEGRRRPADRRRLRRQLLQPEGQREHHRRRERESAARPASSSPTAPTWRRSSAPRRSASVGYGVSPSSTGVAKDTQKYAAPASGLKPVYLNTAVDFGSTDVGPIVLGIKNAGADARVPAARRQHEPRHRAGSPAERREDEGGADGDRATARPCSTRPITKTLDSEDVVSQVYKPAELRRTRR